VRAHFRERWLGLLAGRRFDGLFVCLRSQSRPADFADQFGYNEPVRRAFLARHGRDILREDFEPEPWRELLGESLTALLAEIRVELRPRGLRLAVGAPRGDVLGPPLGNASLPWRRWIEGEIVDELVVNQNSSRCPSMWHDLWPMHRGRGYVQNYLDGHGLPPLEEQLETTYAPVLAGRAARLYVARQWDARRNGWRTDEPEAACAAGSVLSSFRFDNPGPVARSDWRA
jgi:hypothetical protein